MRVKFDGLSLKETIRMHIVRLKRPIYLIEFLFLTHLIKVRRKRRLSGIEQSWLKGLKK